MRFRIGLVPSSSLATLVQNVSSCKELPGNGRHERLHIDDQLATNSARFDKWLFGAIVGSVVTHTARLDRRSWSFECFSAPSAKNVSQFGPLGLRRFLLSTSRSRRPRRAGPEPTSVRGPASSYRYLDVCCCSLSLQLQLSSLKSTRSTSLSTSSPSRNAVSLCSHGSCDR